MSPTSSKLLLSPSLLPLVLLLLTSVLSVSGESFRCSADLTISGTEQGMRIDNGQTSGRNSYRRLSTYVDPMDDFKGVNVVAKMAEQSFNAWFPLPKECFPDDTVTWWKMFVTVNKQKSGSPYIVFLLNTGSCAFVCTKSVSFRNPLKLEVVAYGPSRWRHNEPDQDSCPATVEYQTIYQLRNCSEPPLPVPTTPRHLSHNTTPKPGTTSTPATPFARVHTPSLATAPDKNTGNVTATSSDEDTADQVTRRNVGIVKVVVAAVVVLVVVVVVAVVVVVMVKRYLQRRETMEEGVVMRRTQDASSSSEMVVIENSLYEPFENFRPPQSTDG